MTPELEASRQSDSDCEVPSTTPLLDLKKALPEPPTSVPRWRNTTFNIIALTVGIAFWNYPIFHIAIGYLVVTLLALAVHELGHGLAGISTGLRLEKLVIGPLTLKRDRNSWTYRAGTMLSGLTHMSVQRIPRMRRALLIYYAGGPAASLVVGMAALFACRLEEIGGNATLGLSMAGFSIISLLYGIQGLRSIRGQSYAGDGMMIRGVLCSYEAARQQLAAHALWMMKLRGVDRSQWNRRWMKVASHITELQWSEYHRDWFECESASNPHASAGYLERCLAGSAGLTPEDREESLDELFLAAATFMALYRGDAAKAQVWFERAKHPDRAWTLARIKAEAALHYVRGEYDASIRKWEEGMDFIRQLPVGERTERVATRWRESKSLFEQRVPQLTLF